MIPTDEQIKNMWAYHCGDIGAPLVFARAIEAEVRKRDKALILQLVEALEYHTEQTRPIMESEKAITAGRHRLAEAP